MPHCGFSPLLVSLNSVFLSFLLFVMSLEGRFPSSPNWEAAYVRALPSEVTTSMNGDCTSMPSGQRAECRPKVHSDTSALSPTVPDVHSNKELSHVNGLEINSCKDKVEESSSKYEDTEDERRERQIAELARRLTQHSTFSINLFNSFMAEPRSVLDPNGPNFNATFLLPG
jgi:hypothetical protein